MRESKLAKDSKGIYIKSHIDHCSCICLIETVSSNELNPILLIGIKYCLVSEKSTWRISMSHIRVD